MVGAGLGILAASGRSSSGSGDGVIVAVVWIVLIVGALILHAMAGTQSAEWPRAHSPAPATRWGGDALPSGSSNSRSVGCL